SCRHDGRRVASNVASNRGGARKLRCSTWRHGDFSFPYFRTMADSATFGHFGERTAFVSDDSRRAGTVADVLARLDQPARGLTFPGGGRPVHLPFTRLRELTED